MSVFIIWCVIIFIIIMTNKSNKKKVTKPNTPNMNSGNTSRTQPVYTQKTSQRTAGSTPSKESMAKKKKQLQEHFGMPSGRIHDEIHNDKHVHDENSTLCRANINNDNRQTSQGIINNISVTGTKELTEQQSVLPDTETLIVCGYNGQEFLDSLQYEFNKKFPV